MTGGQMAPTTILGQTTTTSPGGRKERRDGFPINLSEMLAVAKGSAYIERTAVNTPANILKIQINELYFKNCGLHFFTWGNISLTLTLTSHEGKVLFTTTVQEDGQSMQGGFIEA